MRRALTKALIRAIDAGKLEDSSFNDLSEHPRMDKVDLSFMKAVKPVNR